MISLGDFIEELFASRSRIRVLRALLEIKEINVTRLSKLVEMNHRSMGQHIAALKELGIVEEKQFGKIKIVRIRDEDPRVKVIRSMFDELKQLADGD